MRIRERSSGPRADYLARMQAAAGRGTARQGLSCTNLAHGFAASEPGDKAALRQLRWPNLAIVSSYNDMLSAHQPLERYPALIKRAAREAGAVAQFAGGVPAMCDGVTQGQPGMELSLFSRDVIAMATGVALSHNMFDAALCLGICDKIVPGLLMGALAFGHLPVIFVPGGPMPSGVPNKEKARIRELYAEGKAGRDELLDSEAASYHTAGTCTFYGTANSNQMLMEVMGLHLPGAAFVAPNTPLRDALTAAAARRAAAITAQGSEYLPLASGIDERAIVNAIVGLLATGGSTNHTMHLVAIARCAGITVNWDDFSDLSAVVPLLARIYPNGSADINRFQICGGTGFLIRELLDAGLLHEDVTTVMGAGLRAYAQEPWLNEGALAWRAAPATSADLEVLRPASNPFSAHGGLQLLTGNLGRAVIKTSSIVGKQRRGGARDRVRRPRRGHHGLQAGQARERLRRGVALSRAARERHAGVAPADAVARVPAAQGLSGRDRHRRAHVGRIRQRAGGDSPHARSRRAADRSRAFATATSFGSMPTSGVLEAKVPESVWRLREASRLDHIRNEHGTGRELFASFRRCAGDAEAGAISLF